MRAFDDSTEPISDKGIERRSLPKLRLKAKLLVENRITLRSVSTNLTIGALTPLTAALVIEPVLKVAADRNDSPGSRC